MFTAEDNEIIIELYNQLAVEGVTENATIEDFIVDWADDRNLIDGGTPQAQMVKLMEELGELARGLCRGDDALIKDSIGDVYVVLAILAAQCGVDVEGCAMIAYNEIKDRKGKMVDGIFVKAAV